MSVAKNLSETISFLWWSILHGRDAVGYLPLNSLLLLLSYFKCIKKGWPHHLSKATHSLNYRNKVNKGVEDKVSYYSITNKHPQRRRTCKRLPC